MQYVLCINTFRCILTRQNAVSQGDALTLKLSPYPCHYLVASLVYNIHEPEVIERLRAIYSVASD